jgi:hypothetical protein
MQGQHAIVRKPASQDAIIEAVRQGAWLRVSAVCPRTGREVSVVGPATARAALTALAVRRLDRALP